MLDTTSGFLLFVLQQKQKLDYSTRNRKFKRLEPHFQTSAARSAPKEGTKSAVALTHSRECTRELISSLPNLGSIEMLMFGAWAEKRRVLVKKKGDRRVYIGYDVGTFGNTICFSGGCNTGASRRWHVYDVQYLVVRLPLLFVSGFPHPKRPSGLTQGIEIEKPGSDHQCRPAYHTCFPNGWR